jgi:hypothetical protein
MKQYPNLSLAIAKVFEAEADAFMAQIDSQDNAELSDKTERKLRKLVKRRDKSYYPLICTAGRRIACIVAVIFVFALSALSIKPVRATVFDIFIDVFPDHIHISTTHDVRSINSSNFIEREISIPEGFELSEKNITSNYVYKLYKNDDKFIIYTQVNEEMYSASIDNERSTIENYTNNNGIHFTIIKTDSKYIVIWKDENYVYTIKSNLTKNEILDLCK